MEDTVIPESAHDIWQARWGNEWVPLAAVSEDAAWRRVLFTLINEGMAERHELAAGQGAAYRLVQE